MLSLEKYYIYSPNPSKLHICTLQPSHINSIHTLFIWWGCKVHTCNLTLFIFTRVLPSQLAITSDTNTVEKESNNWNVQDRGLQYTIESDNDAGTLVNVNDDGIEEMPSNNNNHLLKSNIKMLKFQRTTTFWLKACFVFFNQ